MKKAIKFLLILVCIIIFITNINNSHVYAASILSNTISGGKGFIDSSSDAKNKIDETTLKDTSSDIYNTLLVISFFVVAIVGITLGIKFMMAGVEEKAQLKHSLIVFFIGATVAYGAFAIWKVMVEVLNKI